MRPTIPVLLLLALPASGKSETRKCLKMIQTQEPEKFSKLGIGETVDLDDFPYVDFMRLIDEVCSDLDQPSIFFDGSNGGFVDPLIWLLLIHLLNEDFEDIIKPRPQLTQLEAVFDMFDRIDRAGQKVGFESGLTDLSDGRRQTLAEAIVIMVNDQNFKGMSAAKKLVREPYYWRVDSLEGRTVVIEFSRGVPKGSPATPFFPFGYRHSLAMFSNEILATACVLYIKVTLEDSIRKDAERATPPEGCEDSTMYHGLPRAVREGSYWGDDFDDLRQGDDFLYFEDCNETKTALPVAIFDNTGSGCTDIFRLPSEEWTAEATAEAAAKLVAAFAELTGLTS